MSYYHGVTLSTTFCLHAESGKRYVYVSDETGFPLEGFGSVRWKKLHVMRAGEQGWRVIGTWPVAKHPRDVWGR